jgi:hypothetical protein
MYVADIAQWKAKINYKQLVDQDKRDLGEKKEHVYNPYIDREWKFG